MGIFSGRRDPEWSVPSSYPEFSEIKQALNDAKTQNFTYGPESMPSRLGYKGFLVKTTKRGKLELIVGPETVKLQKLLLDTAPDGMLSQRIRNIVLKEITTGNVRAQEVCSYSISLWQIHKVEITRASALSSYIQ